MTPDHIFLQLHGVCLGMEALSVAISKNHSILSDFDSENLPSPLFLTGAPSFWHSIAV